jgi:predicted ATP-dependent protease
MSVSGCPQRMCGNSLGVATVCSLLSLVLETPAPSPPAEGAEERSVVVTGALDVRGPKVLPVGGLAGKIRVRQPAYPVAFGFC